MAQAREKASPRERKVVQLLCQSGRDRVGNGGPHQGFFLSSLAQQQGDRFIVHSGAKHERLFRDHAGGQGVYGERLKR